MRGVAQRMAPARKRATSAVEPTQAPPARRARPLPRREVRARVKAAKAARSRARVDRLSLLGYLAVAAMIVAWPREGGSPLQRALSTAKTRRR